MNRVLIVAEHAGRQAERGRRQMRQPARARFPDAEISVAVLAADGTAVAAAAAAIAGRRRACCS